MLKATPFRGIDEPRPNARPPRAEFQAVCEELRLLVSRAKQIPSPTWAEKLARWAAAVEEAQQGDWRTMRAARDEVGEDVIWCKANAPGTVFDELATGALAVFRKLYP